MEHSLGSLRWPTAIVRRLEVWPLALGKGLPMRKAVAAVALAVMLVGASAAAVSAQGQRFSDVPPDHQAFEAIEWAAEAGVTLGYGDGTFRPGLPMHRDHALLFVERFYDDVLQATLSPAF